MQMMPPPQTPFENYLLNYAFFLHKKTLAHAHASFFFSSVYYYCLCMNMLLYYVHSHFFEFESNNLELFKSSIV
jgi:hypothetical protein